LAFLYNVNWIGDGEVIMDVFDWIGIFV
jgi:hypothetical protein